MALDKKDLDALLKKEYGITLPELQQEEKMVSMQEFGIGIQNEILKANLSSGEEKAKISKRAESYIVRAATIMKLAGEAAEGAEMNVPQLPIFAEAQVDKAIVADGKPAELSLSEKDRDVFQKLLEGLGELGKALHGNGDKKKEEKKKETKKDDEIKKNDEPYSWAQDMALELKNEDSKTEVKKKDDKKPEKKKVEKKERSLKTEEEIQKAADDKKIEIQKSADEEKTKAKKEADEKKE